MKHGNFFGKPGWPAFTVWASLGGCRAYGVSPPSSPRSLSCLPWLLCCPAPLFSTVDVALQAQLRHRVGQRLSEAHRRHFCTPVAAAAHPVLEAGIRRPSIIGSVWDRCGRETSNLTGKTDFTCWWVDSASGETSAVHCLQTLPTRSARKTLEGRCPDSHVSV